jgi:hypothetical protein
MNWVKYWFIVFLFELAIWSYIAYLHFEEILNKKPTPKFNKEHKVIVRTKKDIVRG